MKNPITAILIAMSLIVFLVIGYLEWDYFNNTCKNAHPDHAGLTAGLRFLILLASSITSTFLLLISTVHFFIRKQKPRAMLLGTAFFLISIYTGLYMVGVVPPMYTDMVSPSYLELVRKAEKPIFFIAEYKLYSAQV